MRTRNRKEWVIRHGHAPRRARDAEERAIERATRQDGARVIRETFREVSDD